MKDLDINILIINLAKNSYGISLPDSIRIGNKNFYLGLRETTNIVEAYSSFSESKSEYLIIMNSDRWIHGKNDLKTFITQCITFLASIEHYAICQPATIYGKLPEEFKNILKQKKTHTYIRFPDEAFIVLKGTVARNFSILDYVSEDSINWAKYFENINQYGYEALRLNHCFLEVTANNDYPKLDLEPTDSIDLLNSSLKRDLYDIGIDFSEVAPIYNGTSEYATNILPEVLRILNERNLSYQIIANKSIVSKFNLEKYNNSIVDINKSNQSFYRLLFIPQQIFSVATMQRINRICFQFTYTMLDVIALRCRYLSDPRGLDIAATVSYKYAKNVFALSKASSKDIELYFEERAISRKVIPVLLTKEINFDVKDLGFQEKDYILIMGNAYKHKAIEKTLNAIFDTKYNFIILGDQASSDRFRKRFKFYPSGIISDGMMNQIYLNANAILYPSLYEGFGLPVVAALQLGKKVIAYNSDVNRELKEKFDKKNQMILFEEFKNIPEILDKTILHGQADNNEYSLDRKWKDVGAETANVIISDYKSQINWDLLNDRISAVTEIRKILENSHWIQLKQSKHLVKLLLEIFIRKFRWYIGALKDRLISFIK